MKIKLDNLRHSEAFEWHSEDSNLAQLCGYISQEPLDVSVKLCLNGQEIKLQGTINGKILAICSRCAEEFIFPLNVDIETTSLVESDATEFDLTDELRQCITLSIPEKMLCKSTCKGLCPHCGKNLNLDQCTCSDESIDPRWHKLQDLK